MLYFSMASLLSKFRIDYSALKMIPDVNKKPKDSTLAYFDDLIAPFKTTDDSTDESKQLCFYYNLYLWAKYRLVIDVTGCGLDSH